ncbi:MAG: amidohydrolase family protein, partial [Rhodothermales bacterium]
VRGNVIERVEVSLNAPAGATVIDLGDLVLLPGLIDTHTHILLQPGYQDLNPILYKSIPYRTVEAVNAARKTLEAGFTTIRDVDSEGADWADVAVRDGIDDGLIPGPRMQVATRALSITGGYMNQVGLAPQVDQAVPQYGELVDSPEEIVHEIRLESKYGTDWIKIYATGTTRHLDPKNMEPLAQFGYEDIKLAVDEARRMRKPVAAHAYGGQAATDAVRAGVRSIEHGFLLDDDTFALMKDLGTFWVPTLSVYIPDGPRSEWSERERLIVDAHRDAFGRAVKAGVKIAFGTDAGAIPHGANAGEFDLMVDYGMKPADAVRSATTMAAELMDLGDLIGSIEEGKLADIIAVPGNPIEDVRVLHDVRFVMKDGVVVKVD